MNSRTVIDGNAFYEIDEECEKRKIKRENSREKRERESVKYAGQHKNPRTLTENRTG